MAKTAEKVAKPPVPTEKQKAVLDALKGGRTIKIEEIAGKRKLTVLGPTGKPAKEQPKLDRAAVESCHKKTWLTANGGSTGTDSEFTYAISEEGIKAKRRK